MQCEALSNRGVGQLLETIEDVRQFANEKLRVLGVIATMFDGRTTLSRQVWCEVGERYGLARLRATRPEVGALRRGPRLWPLGVGTRTNVTGCGGLPLAVHPRVRRHAERLRWRTRASRTRPILSASAHSSGSPSPARKDPAPAGRWHCRSASVRCSPVPRPILRVGSSPRRTPWPNGASSLSSASDAARPRRVGALDLLIFQFPVGFWRPRRRFDHRMTCPSCRRRAWCSVTLRRG